MLKNTYQNYKQQSIMTMTPGDMLTALYDGVLKEVGIVRNAFGRKDYSEVNRGLQKIQRILRHMNSTLDFKYDISNNLTALYDYFIQLTIQVNIKKDPAGLEELEEFIIDLRNSYVQADRATRAKEA